MINVVLKGEGAIRQTRSVTSSSSRVHVTHVTVGVETCMPTYTSDNHCSIISADQLIQAWPQTPHADVHRHRKAGHRGGRTRLRREYAENTRVYCSYRQCITFLDRWRTFAKQRQASQKNAWCLTLSVHTYYFDIRGLRLIFT